MARRELTLSRTLGKALRGVGSTRLRFLLGIDTVIRGRKRGRDSLETLKHTVGLITVRRRLLRLRWRGLEALRLGRSMMLLAKFPRIHRRKRGPSTGRSRMSQIYAAAARIPGAEETWAGAQLHDQGWPFHLKGNSRMGRARWQ